VNEEFHNHIEDKTRNLKCTRIFVRYPCYIIVNLTDDVLSVSLYGESDFVFLMPSKVEQLDKGIQLLDASGGHVMREQAIFKMPDVVPAGTSSCALGNQRR